MYNFARIYGAKADAQGFYREQAPYLKLTSDKRASRKDNMTLKEYRKKLLELELKPITNSEDLKKFNKDQINLIEWSLNVQEEIFTKNKLNREYYDADIRTLKECKNIINQQASEQKG